MIETDIFSVIFCTHILIYACYSDIKKRSVTNKLWLLMIAAGIPIVTYNMFISGIPFLIRFIFSLSFTFVLSYLFFRFNIFGGADAKCLIAISVLIPVHPSFTLLSYHFPINFNSSLMTDPFPFAITTLFNAAFVSLIAPFSIFFYNFLHLRREELRKNISSAFIGYKLPIDALTDAKQKNKHVRLVHSYEEKEGNLERRHSFGGVEIDNDVVERLRDYHIQGKLDEKVWVTPELPFMLFITAGFFISLFYGNLIFQSLSFLSVP
jgi:archaeal preflagellin peptidase FlaK